MTRNRVLILVLVMIGLISGLGGILGNIAASVLPDTWQPYLWLAWPLFVVSVLALIGLTVWQFCLQQQTPPPAQGDEPPEWVPHLAEAIRQAAHETSAPRPLPPAPQPALSLPTADGFAHDVLISPTGTERKSCVMNDRSKYEYDVFVSYSEEDKDWVQQELISRLKAAGVTYVEPSEFPPGPPKMNLVETAIKESRKTLLVITSSYLKDHWARFNHILSIAYGLDRGEWRTIPVIVERCELPDEISILSCLELYRGDPVKQWERLVRGLRPEPVSLLDEDGTLLLSEGELARPRDAFDSSWLVSLDPPEGAVRLRSRLYVQRENEPLWLDTVIGSGETIRVKGAHQMGKSSLLARMHGRSVEHGQVAFYLDFQRLDEMAFSSLDSLLYSVAVLMARRLRTLNLPDLYWSSPLGSKDKLSDFVLAELLEKAQPPIVLLLDDVDRVFNYDYRDDFFSLIRAWHNERALEGPWQKLNVVLAYSTEAYLFIRNLNESPFNVGVSIELKDFSRSEVEDLNRRHGMLVQTPGEIESLMVLLGGHPYLWRMALYVMATRGIISPQLINTAHNDDGPFAEHLHRYLRQLERWPDLRNAMRNVLVNGTCVDNDSFYRLRASGLVLGHSLNSVQPRCDLYTRYLGERL